MGEATCAETVRARKVHVCSICCHAIAAGSDYQRWAWFCEGSATTIRVHPDCWRLLQDRDVTEWHDGDTWSELVAELSETEIAEEVAACLDPAVGERLRAEWAPLCEPGEDVAVSAWVCVSNARLSAIADYAVFGTAPFGPDGGDLFVADPTAKIGRYEPSGIVSYDWGDEREAGIQWEEWSDGYGWVGYLHADDEDSEVVGCNLEDALAWLRAHPPGEWVKTCADGGTPCGGDIWTLDPETEAAVRREEDACRT